MKSKYIKVGSVFLYLKINEHREETSRLMKTNIVNQSGIQFGGTEQISKESDLFRLPRLYSMLLPTLHLVSKDFSRKITYHLVIPVGPKRSFYSVRGSGDVFRTHTPRSEVREVLFVVEGSPLVQRRSVVTDTLRSRSCCQDRLIFVSWVNFVD